MLFDTPTPATEVSLLIDLDHYAETDVERPALRGILQSTGRAGLPRTEQAGSLVLVATGCQMRGFILSANERVPSGVVWFRLGATAAQSA